MRQKLRYLFLGLLALAIAYWGFNRVRDRSYSGSNIAFPMGSGSVVLTNLGDDPVPVTFRADGTGANFRMTSPELNWRGSSTRQGFGRNVHHLIETELPPGITRYEVTYGYNVRVLSPSAQRIEAVVTPMSPESIRRTIGFTTLVVLGIFFYMSRLNEHQLVKQLWARIHLRLPRRVRKAA